MLQVDNGKVIRTNPDEGYLLSQNVSKSENRLEAFKTCSIVSALDKLIFMLQNI